MEQFHKWLGKLSTRQVGIAAIGVIALMCLFPPWRIQLPEGGFNVSIGYAFLFLPLNPAAAVDAGKLLAQVLLVLALWGGVVFLRRSSAKN